MKVKTALKYNGATVITIREGQKEDYKVLCQIHYGVKPTEEWTEIDNGRWINAWGVMTYDSKIRVGEEILNRNVDFFTATDTQHITIYVK